MGSHLILSTLAVFCKNKAGSRHTAIIDQYIIKTHRQRHRSLEAKTECQRQGKVSDIRSLESRQNQKAVADTGVAKLLLL